MYKAYIKKIVNLLCCKLQWLLFNNTGKLKQNYVDWLVEENFSEKKSFVPFRKNKQITNENIVKIIAFYLPQFYENDVNNENFGKGFMEWYNVAKCIPQFTGHYQPQLPIDTGFYDLSHDDVMYRQIELAKNYGIYGFCFYYYWFSGEKLLEKPLENFLNNKALDIPFCLMWANEEWTNEWKDGQNKKIIMPQFLEDNDDEKFIKDIIKYFTDSRYIKIGNKPLLIIYKSQKFEKNKFIKFIEKIDILVKSYGFDGIYLMTTNATYSNIDIKSLNFKSMIEFSPGLNPISNEKYNLKGKFVNPHFSGKVIDVKKSLEKGLHLKEDSKNNVHKCIYPGWDNSSRKAYCKVGATVLQMTPDDFKKWLSDIYKWTKEKYKDKEQFVFVNAWNEWAEGAHLEPDQKYGYAYLQKIREVIDEN